MANCVKMKMNEKVMRLRSSTLTAGNLSMIFNLDVNQVIYICFEEEGEISLPTESRLFNAEDYTKTYVVNGEPIQLPPSRSSAEPFSTENSANENKSSHSTWPDFQYANFATAELYLRFEESQSYSIMEEVAVGSERSTICLSKRKISSSSEFD